MPRNKMLRLRSLLALATSATFIFAGCAGDIDRLAESLEEGAPGSLRIESAELQSSGPDVEGVSGQDQNAIGTTDPNYDLAEIEVRPRGADNDGMVYVTLSGQFSDLARLENGVYATEDHDLAFDEAEKGGVEVEGKALRPIDSGRVDVIQCAKPGVENDFEEDAFDDEFFDDMPMWDYDDYADEVVVVVKDCDRCAAGSGGKRVDFVSVVTRRQEGGGSAHNTMAGSFVVYPRTDFAPQEAAADHHDDMDW